MTIVFALFEILAPIIATCAGLGYCILFLIERKRVVFEPVWYALFVASALFALVGLMWIATH